jgi:hypothetical protein
MAVEIGQKYRCLKDMRVEVFNLVAAPISDWALGYCPPEK